MEIPSKMRAMVLEQPKIPLTLRSIDVPVPAANQVLVKISSCGVCRTDQHIADWELAAPKLPLILGHEIIGQVVRIGSQVNRLKEGDYVGIPWLANTCGECKFCLSGRENLCEKATFTGFSVNGGFAEFTVANADFCIALPSSFINPSSSPLLCAGFIGYRSYNMLPASVINIGIYGFGAAAHIIIQIAIAEKKNIYVFTKDGDIVTQLFAKTLGAIWAGNSSEQSPVKLDAAIIFAPVGSLIPKALTDIDKGGTVICGGIHMSHIPQFPYVFLWGERTIKSVANLTRKDGEMFMDVVQKNPVKTETTLFPLEKANDALDALRSGSLKGAAVLIIG